MLQLRQYQEEAIKALWEWMPANPGKHPLIVHATGLGKSLLIGEICRRASLMDSNVRILAMTHVAELIEQNYQKIKGQCFEIDAGIYSASLKRKEVSNRILVAQVQSLYKHANVANYRDLLIIDECHLLSPNQQGMYGQAIAALRRFNPKLRIIGLTATPWRMKGGCLVEGAEAMFDAVVHEYGIGDGVRDGYLTPLVSKSSLMQADLSQARTVAGEYNLKDMAECIDRDDLLDGVLEEVARWASNRKSFLWFCASVEHAQKVAAKIGGVSVTKDTSATDRKRMVADFREGRIKHLCNYGVFTTGFDAPCVDCIILLRATKSSGLYIQMLGRGTRLYEGKRDCLVLDFAGNIERFGPVDVIKAPKKRNKEGEASTPYKICPSCREPVAASARACHCGHEWPAPEVTIDHDTEASGGALLSSQEAQGVWHDVTSVEYSEHVSQRSGKKTLVVNYECGLLSFKEWICPEHKGYARVKSEHWWRFRAGPWMGELPHTVSEALKETPNLAVPSRIKIVRDGKYKMVGDYEFNSSGN